jgi:phage terminase Nu1 subunit (DNA packaging protein)
MSKINTKRGASTAEAARHIGLSDVSFAKLLNDGIIERQDRATGYDLTKVRLKCFAHLRSVAAGRGGEDGGAVLSVQRARLAAAQTQAAEFKNMQAQGGYVELSLMQKSLVAMFTTARERALTMPGKCADSLTPHTAKDRDAIHEILRAEIYEMLDDMSDPDGAAAKIANASR